MTSRQITHAEYIRLGHLAWFIIGSGVILYFTNVRA